MRRRRARVGLILAFLLTLAIAATIAAFLVHRSLVGGIAAYTDIRPEPLPAVSLSPAARRNLSGRVEVFRSALEARKATPPLKLTVDEVNALLDAAPGLGGKVRLEIEGDKVRARFCLPMEQLGFPMLGGRYLNGTAALNLSVVDGELIIHPESIEVKSGPLPEVIMARLRKANLARLGFRDRRASKALRKLGGLEVRRGGVEIKVR